MYNILIVGHGGFPKGVHEALNLIVGEQKHVSHKVLNEDVDHDQLQADIEKYLTKNKYSIIFADLTGGAPHKISVRAIHGTKSKTQFVVSGAPLSALMQIALMTPEASMKPELVKKFLEDSLKDAMNFAKVMSV